MGETSLVSVYACGGIMNRNGEVHDTYGTYMHAVEIAGTRTHDLA